MKRKIKHHYYNVNSSLQFKITEAYKTIRANIALSFTKSGCRKIVIASSCPAEGKSTMAVNTAVSIAQTDEKVLLIDCDLRRPKAHRFLSINNTPGLSNYLSSLATLEDIVRPTRFPNLKVVTSGSLVPNPSEILSSEAFVQFISEMEKRFDYIIIDTTPLSVVSDALPLIKLSDGVIMVVREKHSSYTELDSAMEMLERINAKVLGFIYNGGNTKKHYYTYYDHYTSYVD